MTEPAECCLCGARSRSASDLRLELFRYVDGEPGHEYDSGLRCRDRAGCRDRVLASRQAWRVADEPASREGRALWQRQGREARA